ncbi:SPOSA6832_04428 [Sporobolomyces salmonicolor]|uniref:SPOSA6832_04428-mRNA-1:cds n=1 Tax=Sporidiobolus salmonicolor TaxID=5005 RepID=A0A0D6ER56_SPOSA|nr:SPOSA6832_04428 [Sporobolomyces salmonicolor]
MTASKFIVVVSGLGNGTGTGASVARLFAKQLGYRIALLSRPRKEVDELKNEIKNAGGEAEVFNVDKYTHATLKTTFEKIKQTWPDGRLKAAVWNTAQWSNIPFLDIKEQDIELSAQLNIIAATAFAQEAVRAFTASGNGDDVGGTLIMTGATSAWRGKEGFGAFAAGKHGLRALSQSIAREYGPQGVHVAFVVHRSFCASRCSFAQYSLSLQVIDGVILTTRTAAMFANHPVKGSSWLHDEKQRLSPDSIARTYLFLHQQTPDAWTLEMDLRRAGEGEVLSARLGRKRLKGPEMPETG